MSEPERTVTISEAAERTGLTRKAIEQRIARGTLQSVLRDGVRRIPVSALPGSETKKEQPLSSIPDRELLERLLTAEREAGRQEGLRLLSEGQQEIEQELRQEVAELRTRTSGAEQAAAAREQDLKEIESLLSRRQRRKLLKQRNEQTPEKTSPQPD